VRRTFVGCGVVIAVVVGTLFGATRSDAASTTPSVPRSTAVAPGNARATVSWLKPLFDRGFPITSYVVTGKVNETGATLPTVTTTSLTATVTGLTNGKAYTFKVAARNSQGTGTASAGFSVKVGLPGQVAAASATLATSSARVSWSAPASNGGAISGYRVTKYRDGKADGSKTFSSTATAQTIDGLLAGSSYRFLVAAKNTYGFGKASPQSNAIVIASGGGVSTSPGNFATLALGAALPSEATCASQVKRSTWEPRPQNNVANRTIPPQPVTVRNHPDFNSTWQSTYKPRITGNFTGTTDEIIQWASCKWGLETDIIRAQAVQESNWTMGTEGDWEARSAGVCAPGDSRDPCPTSFGMLQIKWFYNPDSNATNNSYPNSKLMTAFSLDYSLAQFRGCYEGLEFFGTQTRGDLWGCLGAWWSGRWRDSGALAYISRVQNHLNAKAWRTWSG
jgi:hypothetical protein